MIKAFGTFKNPKDVEIEITIRMTYQDAIELKSALPEKYPAFQLSQALREILNPMTNIFNSNSIKKSEDEFK